MRFSFCRLLKNIDEKYREALIGIMRHDCTGFTFDLPVAKPHPNDLLLHVEAVSDVCDFLRGRLGVLVKRSFKGNPHCCFN